MTTQQKQGGNFVAIVVMIFLFGMISFVTNLASPMGDILKNQFTVSNLVGTLGVLANFIAYAIMGIPGGIMLEKWGYKKTALAAVAIGFVGVGIQTLSGTIDSSSALIVYLLGAFVAGFSMCLLNIVVNPMLNGLGGGGNRGNQLIQIGGAFNSLCGTAVIVITGLLIPRIVEAKIADVFPLMYAALAIFAFAFVVIAISKIPEREKSAAVQGVKSTHSPLSFRHFALGAIGIFVYVGVEVGIPNVLNKWLQNDADIVNIFGANAESIAASVTGTYWLMMFIGRLVGAGIARRVSAKSMLSWVSLIGIVFVVAAMFMPKTTMVNLPVFTSGSASLFGLAEVPLGAAFFVMCGLCTSVMWGSIFNLAVEGLGKYTERASGIFMTMVCGGGILPLLQNGIIDWTGGTGYLTSYWVIVAGLGYLLFYALVGSKNVNKDIKVD